MNRILVAQARKQLLRRGRSLLKAAQGGTSAGALPAPPPGSAEGLRAGPLPQGPQRDALGTMSDAELTELEQIHAALERIERGIFGRCEECQGPIAEERLERIPWERLCGECRGETRPQETRASV